MVRAAYLLLKYMLGNVENGDGDHHIANRVDYDIPEIPCRQDLTRIRDRLAHLIGSVSDQRSSQDGQQCRGSSEHDTANLFHGP